jgi:hypothetical protein
VNIHDSRRYRVAAREMDGAVAAGGKADRPVLVEAANDEVVGLDAGIRDAVRGDDHREQLQHLERAEVRTERCSADGEFAPTEEPAHLAVGMKAGVAGRISRLRTRPRSRHQGLSGERRSIRNRWDNLGTSPCTPPGTGDPERIGKRLEMDA